MTVWERFKQAVSRWVGSTPEASALPPQASPSALPAKAVSESIPAAPPVAAGPTIFWSKASVVLAGLPDPYNKALADAAQDANRNSDGFKSDSAAGAVYTGIRTAIGLIPVYGQIITVLYEVFNALGKAIMPRSKGGYDDQPVLTKLRAGLYTLGPYVTNDVYKRFKLKSQVISEWPDLDFKPDKLNKKQFYSTADRERYQSNYKKWLRGFLIKGARDLEWYRVQFTSDEAMLPRIIIETLNEGGLWPPPLEPMPLTPAAFLQRYAGTKNISISFQYNHWFDWSLIDLDNPDTQLVHLELTSQYQEDASRFASAIAPIGASPEIETLMRDQGCIPRLGSRANPLPSKITPARY